jgi:hypothetical protein
MSKIICIWKKSNFDHGIEKTIKKICIQLAPDNIQANEPEVHVGKNWSYGIMNPTSSLLKTDSGVMLGKIFGDNENWDNVGKTGLDGSFAIFRNNSKFGEINSDIAGTRSIWYYFDEEYFIASTSQRAMIMFLGSFEMNKEVVPWMLSTGSLGPFLSWDKRIKLLQPDASLTLNKEKWEIMIQNVPIVYECRKLTKKEGSKRVLDAIKDTFKDLNLDFEKWAITLSGGKDSRGILLTLLANGDKAKNIKTYTHGHKGSQQIKGTDGAIAKKIANKYGVYNEFFSSMTFSQEESLNAILERILKVGEGRVDHLKAYVDGFSFWKYLFHNKTEGIVRGDICFGFPFSAKIRTEKEANKFTNFFPCNEWSNLEHLEKAGMMEHRFPDTLRPNKGESMGIFRERIYTSYRLPIVLSALSDFKLSYVEVINPLLSRKIVNAIRTLPENLILGSPIWGAYLNQLENKIPYAHQTTHDTSEQEELHKKANEIKLKLIKGSPYLPVYLQALVPEISYKQKSVIAKLKNKIKNSLSRNQRFIIWRSIGGNHKKGVLPKQVLIDRLFIISEMQRILHEDAQILKDEKNEIKKVG